MKSVKTPTSIFKRPLVWAFLAAILVVVGASAYVYYMNIPAPQQKSTADSSSKKEEIDYAPPTESQLDASEEIKKNKINEEENAQPQSAMADLTISRAAQSAAGQPVSVHMIVTGTVSGQCTLIFTKGDQTVSKTVDITSDATYYTCKASVPVSSFTSSGDWALKAQVTKDGKAISDLVIWPGGLVSVVK